GLLLVLLYAAGESLGARWGGAAMHPSGRKALWRAFGAALAAAFVNPYGWRVWWEPFRFYGSEYPAVRAYLGTVRGADVSQAALVEKAFWLHLDASGVAAILLIALAG